MGFAVFLYVIGKYILQIFVIPDCLISQGVLEEVSQPVMALERAEAASEYRGLVSLLVDRWWLSVSFACADWAALGPGEWIIPRLTSIIVKNIDGAVCFALRVPGRAANGAVTDGQEKICAVFH